MGRHAAPAAAPIERPSLRQQLPILETFVFAPVVGAVAALLMKWSGATWDTSWTVAAAIAVGVIAAAWLTRSTPGQIHNPTVTPSRTKGEGPTSDPKRTP